MRSELLRFGELYLATGGKEIYERLRTSIIGITQTNQGL